MTHKIKKRKGETKAQQRARRVKERKRSRRQGRKVDRRRNEFNRQAAKRKSKKRKDITLPTIELKKKKTGIAAFREKPTLAGKAVKALTSLKTTGVLASILAGGVGGLALKGAGAAVKGGRAVITGTKFAIASRRTITAQRAFPGRAAKSGIDKIFHTMRPIAQRFGTNTKTKGLTTSLISKAGLSIGGAGLLVGAIGSYPFAGFIKEEAIQTLGFAFNTAERNKDVTGMENSLAETDEILNNAQTIMDKVPYANVLKQLTTFFEAAAVKLDNDRRRLETLRGEAEGEETAFSVERRKSDEQARQRVLEQRERDSEYFALIREGKFEKAEELLQSELKGGG